MPSWVETYMARVIAAREHLTAQGIVVQRADGRSGIAAYHVSGFNGLFSNEQLIECAEQYGFDPQAVAG